jgi:hypothetical protein
MFMLVSQDKLIESERLIATLTANKLENPMSRPSKKWKLFAAPEGSSSRGYNDDVGLV